MLSCKKEEGAFNRVFIFTTDKGQRLVARLPFALAGPPGLITQSEVATIHYSESKEDREITAKSSIQSKPILVSLFQESLTGAMML